jgi:signal transduction histidine kinase
VQEPEPEIPQIPTEHVIEIPEEITPLFPEDDKTGSEYPVNYETEEIFAEADKQISQFEKTEEDKIDSQPISEEGAMGNEQLKMIIKAAELVNSTIKIDEVLKNIVEVATDLTNAERGTLYLVDREKLELWSLIAMGSERKEIRVKLGEGLSGFVAKTGEILNIKDVRKDPRWRSDFDKTSGFVTKTVLTFPIKNNKEEIIGVLQLLNSRNGEFSKIDEELLNAISIHAALALQNAEMVEKLLQLERIQSLGKMANFLIQDIKKPILVSKRYVEHLKTKTLPADSAQIIEMLNEQLSQVADLVQTTSSYSEGKTILRTLNVSLNNTLSDYASRITAYVESRNCQIIPEYDKDVTVKLDVKEFYQCYMHIIKNACDAMPDGGNIYISTKRDDKEKRVKLFFRDNGLGIADSLKEKIFEPFFTQGKKEGAGLGLSITRKVVEAHNGKIDVQSSLGEGATFIIMLPTASSV